MGNFLGVEFCFTPTFKTIINFNKITKMKKDLRDEIALIILPELMKKKRIRC